MDRKIIQLSVFLLLLIFGCNPPIEKQEEKIEVTKVKKFNWNAANIYFLLTDRFNNGDESNDINFDRTKETAKLRNFMGGDIKGITKKIEAGYFNDLGVDAIWFSPVFEQIHGLVNEGSGNTYGFHGYWPLDWTALDPNFGTMDDLRLMVETAHKNGIRILLDVVINHRGPVTDKDPVWPSNWVRTSPTCTYKTYETTANCTLVKNLPDIITETIQNVDLPPFLVEKWKSENRYDQEMAELNKFFETTGYSRAPRFYIMKWLVDFIKDLGIDGFRVDTAKHLSEDVFSELAILASNAFKEWKIKNPKMVFDENDFYMMGEVYGYGISGKRLYDFGDRKADYFDHGFNSLINFEFVHDSKLAYEDLFKKYDSLLSLPEMRNLGIVNYISSHDDGHPYDPNRERPLESANKLLLSRGTAQIYYGDESARSLVIEGASGDATLRSFMNWSDTSQLSTQAVLLHWQKLGKFRQAHTSIGTGKHLMLNKSPYIFSRMSEEDKVIIGLELNTGLKKIDVKNQYEEHELLKDSYSGKTAVVQNGAVVIDTPYQTVLLAKDI